MCECLGIHVARRRTLQAVVTHRSRGVEAFLDVALLQQSTLLRRVAPYAGETIGLQLQSHRDRIGRAGIVALETPRLRIDAQQVLNMMPKLVSKYISLSEVTRRAKA